MKHFFKIFIYYDNIMFNYTLFSLNASERKKTTKNNVKFFRKVVIVYHRNNTLPTIDVFVATLTTSQ